MGGPDWDSLDFWVPSLKFAKASLHFLSAILRTVVRFPGQGIPFLLPWLGLS